MKTALIVILSLLIPGFVLSVMLGDGKEQEKDESARKQLNDWQDRDILED